jgi:hypothetical protein
MTHVALVHAFGVPSTDKGKLRVRQALRCSSRVVNPGIRHRHIFAPRRLFVPECAENVLLAYEGSATT